MCLFLWASIGSTWVMVKIKFLGFSNRPSVRLLFDLLSIFCCTEPKAQSSNMLVILYLNSCLKAVWVYFCLDVRQQGRRKLNLLRKNTFADLNVNRRERSLFQFTKPIVKSILWWVPGLWHLSTLIYFYNFIINKGLNFSFVIANPK